jgi:aspartate carbamoyltransferase catalytic subunit
MNLRHFVSAGDLSRENAIELMDTTHEMAQVGERDVKKLPSLRGRTVVNLFYEDSTRTRVSFEVAEKRLSADVINVSAKGSSVSKGESLKDTVQTLAAISADIIVMRHGASGAAHKLATSDWFQGSVVNAGDGTHEHPTQALLDAYTLRSKFSSAPLGSDLTGLKIAIVGDISHSRVARSNILLLKTLGAKVTLIGPPTLLPSGLVSLTAGAFYNFDEALESRDFDAVMMLRVQSERMQAAFFPSEAEYSKLWGLSRDRFARLSKEVIVMHPGPMNRGLEIDGFVADSSNSVILDQVRNGVSARMAVLFHLTQSDRGLE